MVLTFQIYHECKKFGRVYNIQTVCAYGGGSMWEQQKACQEGAEIIVATPVGLPHFYHSLALNSGLGAASITDNCFAVLRLQKIKGSVSSSAIFSVEKMPL